MKLTHQERNKQIDILKTSTEERIEEAEQAIKAMVEEKVEPAQHLWNRMKAEIDGAQLYTQEMLLKESETYKKYIQFKLEAMETRQKDMTEAAKQQIVNMQQLQNRTEYNLEKILNHQQQQELDSLISLTSSIKSVSNSSSESIDAVSQKEKNENPPLRMGSIQRIPGQVYTANSAPKYPSLKDSQEMTKKAKKAK